MANSYVALLDPRRSTAQNFHRNKAIMGQRFRRGARQADGLTAQAASHFRSLYYIR